MTDSERDPTAVEQVREIAESIARAQANGGKRRQLFLPVGAVVVAIGLAWQAATHSANLENGLGELRVTVEAKADLSDVQIGHLREIVAEVKSDVAALAADLRATSGTRDHIDRRLSKVEADVGRVLSELEALRRDR